MIRASQPSAGAPCFHCGARPDACHCGSFAPPSLPCSADAAAISGTGYRAASNTIRHGSVRGGGKDDKS